MTKPRPDLETVAPLPKGRHALPAAEVARHQRERIAAAVAATLAEVGYGALTVERVISAARISRSTFYVHFANKQEAVLAAHELVFERFLGALTAACDDQIEWPMKVRAAVDATIEFAVSRPEQTQILSTGALLADLAAADRVAWSHDHLATLLRGARGDSPFAGELPECTERFLVAAITAIVARHLAQGEAEHLRSLKADLVELTLIPYYGAAEAARLAGRAV